MISNAFTCACEHLISCAFTAYLVQVRLMHNVLGGTIDPHASFLVMRGVKTLDLRVQRHNATALELARRLAAHPKIAFVHYPGAPPSPCWH